MTNVIDKGISNIGKIDPFNITGMHDEASAPVAEPKNPLSTYLSKARTSGRSEGAARNALEEEKRRRFEEYKATLLARESLGGTAHDFAGSSEAL